MKILWHMPILRQSCCGLSRRALQLARELALRGHRIQFAVHAEKTDITGTEIEGFPLAKLNTALPDPWHWLLQSRARVNAAKALVRALPADHDLFISCQPEVVTAYAKRAPGCPVLFVCGGSAVLHEACERREQLALPWTRRRLFATDRWMRGRAERAAFASAQAVVFDSETTCRRVSEAYALPLNTFHAVLGGVDPRRYLPADEPTKRFSRSSLGIRDGTMVIAWTGRLSPEKNIELLVRALVHLPKPDVMVLLAGDGPEAERLVALADELGVGDIVRFLGVREDVRPILHAADLFVFPSRGESFGGALAEAMACGLPCLSLRSGGIVRTASEEILEHGVSGWFADDASPAALAAAIRTLAQRPILRSALGAAARNRAVGHFTWSNAGSRLHDILTNLTRTNERESVKSINRKLTCALPST